MEVKEDANNYEVVNTDILKCELNTLSRSDGSCVLCQNDTVIATAVYGPVEVKQHKMLIDRAYVEIIFKPMFGLSQIGDRLLESIIHKICETAILTTFYPRTAVYIIVQEIQKSEAALATSINAVCLALIHAGITMNFLFAAVSSKKKENEPTVTFVFENTSEKILAIDSHGKITAASYERYLKTCRRSSEVIFNFYKEMIKKYALKM